MIRRTRHSGVCGTAGFSLTLQRNTRGPGLRRRHRARFPDKDAAMSPALFGLLTSFLFAAASAWPIATLAGQGSYLGLEGAVTARPRPWRASHRVAGLSFLQTHRADFNLLDDVYNAYVRRSYRASSFQLGLRCSLRHRAGAANGVEPVAVVSAQGPATAVTSPSARSVTSWFLMVSTRVRQGAADTEREDAPRSGRRRADGKARYQGRNRWPHRQRGRRSVQPEALGGTRELGPRLSARARH